MTASRRLSVFSLLAVLSFTAGLVAATQDVAAAFHFPREFGGGLADIGPIRFYPPWAFLGWYARFDRTYPQAFDLASLVGLAVGLVPLALAIVLVRRGRRLPRAFGAAAWAQIEDVKRAKLIDPKGRMTGRVLGRFPDRLAGERVRL
jgi:type IV secretion system protein VirD4